MSIFIVSTKNTTISVFSSIGIIGVIDKTIKESIFINTLLLGNLSFIVLLSANRIIGIDSKFNIAIVPSLNNMLSSIK